MTDTTRGCSTHWFETDHNVKGDDWHYYFCQREAIETLIYLYEVRGLRRLSATSREAYPTECSVSRAKTASRATS